MIGRVSAKGRVATAAGALLLAVLARPDAAQARISGEIDGGVTADGNVFRLPDQPVPGLARADTIVNTGAAVSLDATPGDFIVRTDLSAAYQKYARNTALDNLNFDLQTTVRRPPGARFGLSGNVEVRRSLTPFENVFSIAKNIQQYYAILPRISVPATADISVYAAPSFTASLNSAKQLQAYDYHAYGVEVGGRLDTPLDNSIEIGLGVKRLKGLRPRLVRLPQGVSNQPLDFEDVSLNTRLVYNVSSFTRIDAQLAYVRRIDKSALHNNTTAPYGEIAFAYQPRDSFGARIAVGRQQQTLDYLYVDAVRSTYADVSASFRLQDRLLLTPSVRLTSRSLIYNPSLNFLTLDRNERLLFANLAAEYPIGDRLVASGSVAHTFRHSNAPQVNFAATIFRLGLAWRWGERQ